MAHREESLLQTDRFRVVRLHPESTDNTPPREIVRHPGAVTIFPLLEGGNVCLIKNRRLAVGKTLVELPAGTRQSGEDPRDTAIRELREETGYNAGRIEQFGAFYLSPGILDERMHLFLARNLTPGPCDHQADEQIENYIVPVSEALQMIDSGQIEDAKTIVGLMFYQRLLAETET